MELTEAEKQSLHGQTLIQLPFGLLGFESVKNYLLFANPQEEPFMWLQMMDTPKKSFVVVSPFLVKPDYQPDIAPADVAALGLVNPSDALLFNICTIRSGEAPTINLKGPIVINRRTLVAKQCIPNNATDYSLRHTLSTS